METNEKAVLSDVKNNLPHKKNNKAVMAGILAVVIIALAVGIGFAISNGSAKKISEQLDLGQKYMEEMDYEQAVVTFNGIIEIDDKCVGAYLGLTETYIRMGEYDKALETAQKGYERTGDERLAEYMDMLESGNVMRSDGKIMKRTGYDADGAVLYYHEFTYDKEGREASVAHYDSNHALVSALDLLYDEAGNELVSYYYNGDTGDLFKTECIYENGFLISEKAYQEDGVAFSTYEYDEKGRVIKKAESTDYDDGEHLDSYCVYQYDENDNMIRSEESEEHYGEIVSCGYYTFEYQNGELYKQSFYSSDGDLCAVWVHEKDGIYEYDSAGNLTKFTKNE